MVPLVSKAHRLSFHSTLGSRLIKKKNKYRVDPLVIDEIVRGAVHQEHLV